MLDTLRQDMRYGARKLRAAPSFTLIAVVTLALGIGANTVMFGIVDAMLFRPPAQVSDPGRLARLALQLPAPPGDAPQMSGVVSYPDFVNVRDRARGLSRVAAYARTSVVVGRGDDVRNQPVILASGDYFPMLGTRAAAGRLLSPADDRENAAAPVAVLSWDYFQRVYGGDARTIGRTIILNGHAFTIVGVAPKHFTGIEPGSPSVWAPLNAAPDLGYDAGMVRSPFASWLSVVARLASDVSTEQARSSVQAALLAARDEGAELPAPGLGPGGGLPSGGEVRVQIGGGRDGRGGGAPSPRRASLTKVGGLGDVGPRGGGRDGPSLPVSLWFLAVTGTLLLIACANVANLLLARAAARAHEIAIRLSLGATRDRLTRQLLTESLLLAVLGGLAGVGIAVIGARLLPSVLRMPSIAEIVDRRALVFTGMLTVLTTLAFGLAPAVRAGRQDLNAVLGAGRARPGRTLGRDALVVLQLGASLALLVSAGLFVRSLRNVRAVDTGFALDRILLVSADVRGGRFTREESDAYWRRALERVRALPGVRSASLGVAMPFEMNINFGVDIPAAPSPDGRRRLASADFASPDYFATLGIPVVRGRGFTAADVETSAPVAIVNQSFVRRYLSGIDPLAACIRAGGGGGGAPVCVPIVGVVADARFTGVTRDPEPFMFRPITQRPRQMPAVTMMHVRTAGEPALVRDAVRRELQALDARVAFATVRPMTALVEPQLAPWRIGTFVFTLLGALGALLAVVGLYGLVSFVVAQRTRELGVRIALGARSRDVLSLVLGHGARLVVVGLAAGAFVAALASRLFASLMFGVSPLDPVVYVAMGSLLALVAVLAALVPARRATHVDPVTALRGPDL